MVISRVLGGRVVSLGYLESIVCIEEGSIAMLEGTNISSGHIRKFAF